MKLAAIAHNLKDDIITMTGRLSSLLEFRHQAVAVIGEL